MIRDRFFLRCSVDWSAWNRHRCPSCAKAVPIHAGWIYADRPSTPILIIHVGSVGLIQTLCSWDLSVRGPSVGCICLPSCRHPCSVLSHNLRWSFSPPPATSADLLCDTCRIATFRFQVIPRQNPDRISIPRRGGRFVPPVRLRPGPPLRHFIHSPRRSFLFSPVNSGDLEAFLCGNCPNPRNRTSPRPHPPTPLVRRPTLAV